MKIKCHQCSSIAQWKYLPANEREEGKRYYCDEHISRGCSCQKSYISGEEYTSLDGQLLPCVEYDYAEHGYNEDGSTTMIKVDWELLSPKEIWEAIKTAPKIAGPWIKFDEETYGECWERGVWNVARQQIVQSWRLDKINGKFFPPIGLGIADNDQKTLEEAQKITDAELQKLGWLLVND